MYVFEQGSSSLLDSILDSVQIIAIQEVQSRMLVLITSQVYF